MSGLPGGLVTYNQPVRCVYWNNTEKRENPVTVECDDGEKIAADHVIVTVPLGSIRCIHTQAQFAICLKGTYYAHLQVYIFNLRLYWNIFS